MLITRNLARCGLTMAIAIAASSAATQAQAVNDYPNKAVRIIAPFAAGTGPDTNAREIAAELGKYLGQSAYVDNRPGASGIIGTEAAAKAAPDGYTLYLGVTSTLSVIPHVYSTLPFDVEKDFEPVSLMGVLNTGLIANPKVPAKDVKELIQYIKAKPDALNTATAGPASYSHLSGEWFRFSANVPMNLIPYNSNSPYTDLVGGQVQLMFDALPAAVGNIHAGKLKLLAITGEKRHPAFPDVPTFAEAGLTDYNPIAWQGLFVPAGTPKAIIDKLSAAMNKAAQNSPALAKKWSDYGGELKGSTPEEFAAFLAKDRVLWGEVVKKANVKLN